MRSRLFDNKKESAIQKLSEQRRSYLWDASQCYRKALPGSPAEEYLQTRGLGTPLASPYGLGYVEDPAPGHEQFRGFLSIPYLRWSQWRGWSVASIRFRCIENHDHRGHGKYMTVAGDQPRLYNTPVLTKHALRVGIAEGELDAVTASLCGLPTVGVPGAQAWQRFYREMFLGYQDVFVLADGDEPGAGFAETVAKTLPNAKVIPCPTGYDVNSLVQERGKQALLERLNH